MLFALFTPPPKKPPSSILAKIGNLIKVGEK